MRLDRTLVDLADVIRDALLIAQPSANSKTSALVRKRTVAAEGLRRSRPARAGRVQPDLERSEVHRLTAASSTCKCGASAITRSWCFPTAARVSQSNSCPACSSCSARRTVPRRACTQDWASASSIVKSLVEAHNGTVQVHSAGEGMGSTFVVTLPVAVWDQSAKAVSARDTQPASDVPSLAGSACWSSMMTKKAGTWWRHTCTGATRLCRRRFSGGWL